jgi:hypothetical protein
MLAAFAVELSVADAVSTTHNGLRIDGVCKAQVGRESACRRQWSDLNGESRAERNVKLPNSFYYLP